LGRARRARRRWTRSGKTGRARTFEESIFDTDYDISARTDFYQTPSTVIVSFYLKKIDKEKAKIDFTPTTIDFDLPTTDNKRFKETYELFSPIDPDKSQYTIMGTKMEMTLAKAEDVSWPVLRKTDRRTGEIIQAGRAKRA
jgi:hypothetical protein